MSEEIVFKKGDAVRVWSLQSFYHGGFINGTEGIVSQDQIGDSVLVSVMRNFNGEYKSDKNYEVYPQQLKLIKKKETMKRYKLVIPDNMGKVIDQDVFRVWNNKDVNITRKIEDDVVQIVPRFSNDAMHRIFVLKEWLHEIEEEKPIQPEKWMKKYTRESSKTLVYDRTDMRNAFRAGEGNNKLRHRETVSCDAYFALTRPTEKISSLKGILFVEGWDACKKSHNLD